MANKTRHIEPKWKRISEDYDNGFDITFITDKMVLPHGSLFRTTACMDRPPSYNEKDPPEQDNVVYAFLSCPSVSVNTVFVPNDAMDKKE